MTENIDRCPLCGSSDIEVKIAPVTLECGTKGTITVDKCKEIVCKYCTESFFTKETSKKIEENINKYLKVDNYDNDKV